MLAYYNYVSLIFVSYFALCSLFFYFFVFYTFTTLTLFGYWFVSPRLSDDAHPGTTLEGGPKRGSKNPPSGTLQGGSKTPPLAGGGQKPPPRGSKNGKKVPFFARARDFPCLRGQKVPKSEKNGQKRPFFPQRWPKMSILSKKNAVY